MNAKQIIALIVGLLGVAVTAWKGPQAWGFVASGLTAIVLFVSTYKIAPKQDEEYIQDLEDALSKSPSPVAAAGENLATEKSRARFARRVVKL